MVENDPWTLLGMQAALPLGRRGYDCDATDALIKEIKERLESALAARDERRHAWPSWKSRSPKRLNGSRQSPRR